MDRTEKWLLAVACVLLVIALFLNLGIFPLYNEEPRRALIALEMLFRDNLIVPTELGEFYYKKPPLYNWLVIGAFKIFGLGSEFGLRFISVVSLLLMGALTFWWVRKYGNVRLAIYSALFFVISADIFFYFSLSGEIDIFYSLVTYAMFVAVFHFYKQEKKLALYLIPCFLTAIGFLTKGLPSIVFAITTFSALFFYKRKFWELVAWQHVAGIALFFAVIGLYFYAYSFYNNPLNFFSHLWSQSSQRTVAHTGFAPLFLHLIKFPFVVLKDTLPASLFLLLVFRKDTWKSIWQNELLQYCVVIFLANIVVYWISPGTRSRYHYMLYPLLVIVCTHLLLEFGRDILVERALRIVTIAAVVFIFIAGCVLPFVENRYHLQSIPFLAGITILVSAGLTAAFYFFRKPVYLHFILLVIGGRILFDLYVLPVRAAEGEHIQFKHDAEKIADITQGKNLYIYHFYGDGTYSLGNAFYLELARKQVLTINQQHNCEDFFIVHTHEPGHTWQVFYEFDWRVNHYYLVKFTDCGGNG